MCLRGYWFRIGSTPVNNTHTHKNYIYMPEVKDEREKQWAEESKDEIKRPEPLKHRICWQNSKKSAIKENEPQWWWWTRTVKKQQQQREHTPEQTRVRMWVLESVNVYMGIMAKNINNIIRRKMIAIKSKSNMSAEQVWEWLSMKRSIVIHFKKRMWVCVFSAQKKLSILFLLWLVNTSNINCAKGKRKNEVRANISDSIEWCGYFGATC